MARSSTINTLVPKPLLERINALFAGGTTIDQVLAMLRTEPDAPEISRSALGRHRKSISEVADKLRYAREFTLGLRQQIGDASEAEQARLNNELVQTAIFDLLIQAEDGTANAGMIKAASEALRNLAQASKINQDFIAQVEKRAREKAIGEAAARAETSATTAGLSPERAAQIRRDVLGLRPKPPEPTDKQT